MRNVLPDVADSLSVLAAAFRCYSRIAARAASKLLSGISIGVSEHLSLPVVMRA